MLSHSSSRTRLGLFLGIGLVLSLTVGQLTSYVVHRNQTVAILRSVLNATLFQENSTSFESDLRMLFSSLQANNEDPGRLSIVFCHNGDIIASAPRWISSGGSFDCNTPRADSPWKFEIRESILSSGFPILAVVHRELSPWNRYATSTTLLLWLIGCTLALWASRMTFQRRRILSMFGRLEGLLFSSEVSTNSSLAVKIPGWSAPAGKVLEERVSALKASIERAQKEYADSKSEAEVGKIAQQAAHDIRAPLAVIDFVGRNLNQLPEGERVLLRKAIHRFREIADDLLYLGRKPAQKTAIAEGLSNSFDVHSLQGIVQEISSEKAIQFKNTPTLLISAETDTAQYGKFVSIQAGLFKRVLSNIINNAAEAMKFRGEVRVSIHESNSDLNRKLFVRVRDNGPGIPPELLSQLGNMKLSYGKSDGSGLGLLHAKETLLSWNGDLRIESAEGQGTCVELEIPLAPPPAWFCPEIRIPASRSVVILDDDPLIHSIWDRRISELASENSVQIIPRHFTNGPDFSRWLELNPKLAADTLFLLDLELAGESETGMDLIERHGLSSRAVMVTSQYEYPSLIERCIREGCQLLPKLLASAVPVRFYQLPGLSTAVWDAVIVDDDDTIREIWMMYAEAAGKELRAFASAEDFLRVSEQFNRNTPIYLDENMEPGMSGIAAAKILRKSGFTNIGLATGFPKENFQTVPWIDFVGDKKPPWILGA